LDLAATTPFSVVGTPINSTAVLAGDLLVGGPGYDLLRGGRDADIFKFNRGDSHIDIFTPIADVIVDFEDGIDHFDVPGKGLGAVDLTKIQGGTLVEYHGGSFVVAHYLPGDWSNGDFI
jgi:Ca2+-binding RTX toxin-like protein